jgi:hypothetical protein
MGAQVKAVFLRSARNSLGLAALSNNTSRTSAKISVAEDGCHDGSFGRWDRRQVPRSSESILQERCALWEEQFCTKNEKKERY